MKFKRKEDVENIEKKEKHASFVSRFFHKKETANVVFKDGTMSNVSSKKDLIFYIAFLIWPLLQFAVMYVGVNFNSILLAFQKIDIAAGTRIWTLDTFGQAFYDMFNKYEWTNGIKMSLLSFVFIQGIGIPISLLFSYYIYKGKRFGNFFRVVLFLPAIISAIVMTTIYKQFVSVAFPAYFGNVFPGLLDNDSTVYGTIIFYNIWVGFGTSILLYSNAMSGIPKETTEAALLDGATGFTEFRKIVLPSIFPTIKTFLITAIAGIFANQIGLFSFGQNAFTPERLRTVGYLLYTYTYEAKGNMAAFPYLSAMGLIITIIVVPTTLIISKLLDRYGPSDH